MSSRSFANLVARLRAWARWLLPCVIIVISLLACGLPYRADLLSSGNQSVGPYWACATATPFPTYQVTEEITSYGTGITPTVEVNTYDTTPVPTETPYYRTGAFFLGQPAQFGSFRILLESRAVRDGLTLATFRVTNSSEVSTTVTLSLFVFGLDAANQPLKPANDRMGQLGLPEVVSVEAEPLLPGTERLQTLAFPGDVQNFGLATEAFADTSGGSVRPVWFQSQADPIPCPYGAAINPPQPTLGARGMGQTAPGARAVSGPVPISARYHVSTTFGCNKGYGRTSGGVFVPAKSPAGYGDCGFGEGFHAGLDLATFGNKGACCVVYAPVIANVYHASGGCGEGEGGCGGGGYGNYVILRVDTGDGRYVFMYFGHLYDTPFVVENDTTECGQALGFVGTTGNSTGPHLHWETRLGSDPNSSRSGVAILSPDETRPLWDRTCQPDTEPIYAGGQQ